MAVNHTAAELRREIEYLIDAAYAKGYIITVERKPLRPLRTGHAGSVVDIRVARQAEGGVYIDPETGRVL